MVEESLSLPSTRDRDRNGEQEFRKRAKLRVIEAEEYKVRIK